MRRAPCLLALVWLVTSVAFAQQPAVTPDTPIRQLHASLIKPSSDAIFNVGRDAPKSAEAWATVRQAAVTLAESGRQLMRAAPPAKRATWMRRCRELVNAAVAARKAAEARNVRALMKAPDRLVIVCESCHAAFRKAVPEIPTAVLSESRP